MHIESNNISEFETWIKEEESLGAKNLMSFFMFQNNEKDEIKETVISAFTEVLVFQKYWVQQIVSFIGCLVVNKSVLFAKDAFKKGTILHQLTYNEAFIFLGQLDESERNVILNNYCTHSFLYNAIIDAVSKNDYNAFLNVLGKDDHSDLMRYLFWLDNIYSYPYFKEEDFKTFYDLGVFFASDLSGNIKNYDTWQETIRLIEYENDYDIESIPVICWSSIGVSICNMLAKAKFNDSTLSISHINFYPRFIDLLKSSISTKAQLDEYINDYREEYIDVRSDIIKAAIWDNWDGIHYTTNFEKEDFRIVDAWIKIQSQLDAFLGYIVENTKSIYEIYDAIKPFLNHNEINVLEWYLNSSEYYMWYNSIMSSTKAVPINKDINNSGSLENREIGEHMPDFPCGEDKQPIYNFVLKEPLSDGELETLYICLVDEEFIDKYTPIQNLIHVLGGTRPKDYKPVHWIKKAKNNKICKKSVLNLMVYLGGKWDDISSSTKKDLLDRLNYCFVAGDTPFSYKNLKDSKSYNKNYYNAHSEARHQLLEIMGKVFGKDSDRYSGIQELFEKSGLWVPC